MRMKPLALILLLAVIASAAIAADDIKALLGTWESKNEEGKVTLVFKSESRLVYNDEEIGFVLAPGVIRVEDEALGYVEYPYALKNGILAITYPEGYRLQFTRAASKAKGDAAPTGGSDLVNHFAGTWKNYTKYTETMVVLYPDGTYGERYTSSYGGSEPGDEWGAAADVHKRGQWSIRGNKEQGIITFTNDDGTTSEYEYRVHVENGETYWREYYFNGNLYGKVNE
jgi:hypothetical protein